MKRTNNIPFSNILVASKGDALAIKQILNHYESYINKLCLRPLCDGHGQKHISIDSELKGRIQTAVIAMVLKFKMHIVS